MNHFHTNEGTAHEDSILEEPSFPVSSHDGARQEPVLPTEMPEMARSDANEAEATPLETDATANVPRGTAASKRGAYRRRGLKPFRALAVANGHQPESRTVNQSDLKGHVENGHVENGHLAPPREASVSKESGAWQVVLLPLDALTVSPFQSREHFDEAELQELAASIKAYGVQQPVLVRALPPVMAPAKSATAVASKTSMPRYELVTGERRMRASRLAGKKVIPAFVRELSDLAAAEIAVIENVQRANLSVIEEARGYRQLALKFRLKEERIARKVGKSVQTIRDALRLLALPEAVQALLSRRALSAAHGHELLRLATHPAICEAVAARAVRDRLTATSLAGDILPLASELLRAGRIVELGHGTIFDWRDVCKECPHKSYLRVGYRSYCLEPDQWRAKQEHARALEKQEAAQVMEQARRASDGALEPEAVRQVRHRSLLGVQVPAGCGAGCPCRSEAMDDADLMRRYPICLDPTRFEELRDAERKANEHLRRQKAAHEFEAATRALQGLTPPDGWEAFPALREGVESEVLAPGPEDGGSRFCSQAEMPGDGQPDGAHSRVAEDKVAALLVLPLLKSQPYGYGSPGFVGSPSWPDFVGGVAHTLSLELPIEKILDAATSTYEALELLRAQRPQHLLLLGAGLVLALEAQRAARFAGETPHLDFALGRTPARQTHFDGEEWGTDEAESDHEPIGLDEGDVPEDELAVENESVAMPMAAEDPETMAPEVTEAA